MTPKTVTIQIHSDTEEVSMERVVIAPDGFTKQTALPNGKNGTPIHKYLVEKINAHRQAPAHLACRKSYAVSGGVIKKRKSILGN